MKKCKLEPDQSRFKKNKKILQDEIINIYWLKHSLYLLLNKRLWQTGNVTILTRRWYKSKSRQVKTLEEQKNSEKWDKQNKQFPF